MVDVQLRGTEDLAALTKALRRAGEQGKGLRKELYAGLNRATKETRADMKASIPASLPSRGGLADLAHARARMSTSAQGGRNPGVRIWVRGKSRSTLRRADRTGQIRHPVFGNRRTWVNQSAGVQAGLLEEPFQKSKPHIVDAVLDAIENVRSQIYRRV